MSLLDGYRVLLIEDEFLIALMAKELLAELGATVLGPVGTVDEAMTHIAVGNFEMALVDMNLAGQRSDPAIQLLSAAKLPFVVATGYGAAGAPIGAIVVEKPYSVVDLEDAFRRVLSHAEE